MKPAILPGPVMFHIRQSERDFKYFIYTLLEQNDQLERITFAGSDRDKAQRIPNAAQTMYISPVRKTCSRWHF